MKRITFLLFYLFCAVSLHAADFSVNASTDKTSLGTDDNLTLSVTVTSSGQNLPDFKLPEIKDFNVYGSSKSQSYSFTNGVSENQVTYSFVLIPKMSGTLTIPAFSIISDGQVYSTDAIKIEVTEGQSHSAVNVTRTQVSPKGLYADSGDEVKTIPKDIFVKAFTDKKSVHVNEPVVFTFQLFSAVNILANPSFKQPEFTGFIAEVNEQSNYETTIAGKKFGVNEFKILLFPQKEGTLTIPKFSLVLTIDDFRNRNADFFGLMRPTRNVALETDPVTLKVTALPQGVSMNGAFQISARTDTKTFQTDTPFNLIVTISGNGNIKTVPTPKINVSDNLKLYETSSSSTQGKTIEGFKASKEFSTLIMPLSPGEATISIEPLKYFDPKTKTVKTLKVKDITFTVTGEAKAQTETLPPEHTGKVVNHTTGTTTYNIDLSALPKTVLLLKKSIPFALGALLILVLIKIYLIYLKKQNKDVIKLKSRKAASRAKKYFKQAKKAQKAKDFYGAMYKGILEYFASIFKQSAEGLTTNQIKNMMTEAGEKPELTREIEDILNECQAMLYSNAQINDNTDTKDFYDKVFNTLNKVEKR
jgi:hypothetical protein